MKSKNKIKYKKNKIMCNIISSTRGSSPSLTFVHLFFILGNELTDGYFAVFYLTSDVRVVSEGEHQRPDGPSVGAADQPGALVKNFSLNVVYKPRVLLYCTQNKQAGKKTF